MQIGASYNGVVTLNEFDTTDEHARTRIYA